MIDLRTITIVSGGQTGVDRAALDFAIRHGIQHGGWCPRERLAEDGPIPPRYQLRETPSRQYAQRTEWNVRDSDATVLFTTQPQLQGGTALTRDVADRLGKPWLHLVAGERSPLAVQESAGRLTDFLAARQVRCVNVAGPRSSQDRHVAEFVDRVLESVWAAQCAGNL